MRSVHYSLFRDPGTLSAVPLLSIGMPVFNGADSIGASIESQLTQTVRDFELIICDNASTDATAEVCARYAAADPRIHYHRNPQNLGANPNYNLVLAHASAPFFKWASANDLCAPTFLERCLEPLQADPAVVLAYPRTTLIDGGGWAIGVYDDGLDLREDDPCLRLRHALESLRLNNVMNGVIRRATLARIPPIGPYPPADLALVVELALHGKFVEVPEPLFFRRFDRDSTLSLRDERDVVPFHDPTLRSRMLLSQWRLHAAYFGAAWRAPLTPRQRRRAFEYLGRQVYWSRRRLWADLVAAARKLSSRSAQEAPSETVAQVASAERPCNPSR
jgi:glycosyltransferase involved in cell wall biosynthesis